MWLRASENRVEDTLGFRFGLPRSSLCLRVQGDLSEQRQGQGLGVLGRIAECSSAGTVQCPAGFRVALCTRHRSGHAPADRRRAGIGRPSVFSYSAPFFLYSTPAFWGSTLNRQCRVLWAAVPCPLPCSFASSFLFPAASTAEVIGIDFAKLASTGHPGHFKTRHLSQTESVAETLVLEGPRGPGRQLLWEHVWLAGAHRHSLRCHLPWLRAAVLHSSASPPPPCVGCAAFSTSSEEAQFRARDPRYC